jgi:hypothetical protein
LRLVAMMAMAKRACGGVDVWEMVSGVWNEDLST